VSSEGVAFVLDTSAYAIADMCATDVEQVTLEVWEPALRLHVFVGSDPLDALAKMSAFVGRPRVPPPWAFAPWNDAIKGEENVLAFAEFLRARDIPSSAIWSEDWRGGEQRGDLYRLEEDWRLDRAVYPNYEEMTSTLRARGFAHQVYFNTFLTETADIFEETAGAGLAVNDVGGGPLLFDGADANFSPTGVLDLTNDDAIAYVKGHLKDALALGARGWMADYAEWMPIERAVLASGEDPELVHNRYPVSWAEVNDAAVRESGLEDEVCVYHRSGHLYSQRHVQIMWAGDQRTSFQDDDGFATVIRIGPRSARTQSFLPTN
jgi:alpha-glucosidase